MLQKRSRRINLTLKCWITTSLYVMTYADLPSHNGNDSLKVNTSVMMDSQQPRIVVIGAGAAGLGAVTKLKELGFTDLTLVEAADVVGGRIAKANLGKSWVDTGAQFIHGASSKNPLYCLFKTSGLLSQFAEEGDSVYYRRNGQEISNDFAERVFGAGEGIIRQLENSSAKSIGEHFAVKTQGALKSWPAEEKKDVQSVLALVEKEYLISIAASDLHKVSKDSWQYYIDMGDERNAEGFMYQIVEKLAEDFPKEHLLLNKTVSKVEWDGSFPGTGDLVHPVRVVCEDGEEVLADHVIITVSLGFLKAQAATLFNPSLPPEKMEVIDKLCFGNIAKLFLEYEEPFWDSNVGDINLIWDDDSDEPLSTSHAHWLKHLSQFTVMKPTERFGNVLIGWCPGNISDLVETLTEQELSSAVTELLRVFTGNPNIKPPKSVLCTKWGQNNFTRGSYTFIPVGVNGQVMDVLAQPLVGKNSTKDLQVLFAGEATVKSLYSTVQGALISGHREAERLAKLYGRTVPPAVHCDTHT